MGNELKEQGEHLIVEERRRRRDADASLSTSDACHCKDSNEFYENGTKDRRLIDRFVRSYLLNVYGLLGKSDQ